MNNKTARTAQIYKALMTDVDGTLIVNGGGTTISAKVKQSIKDSQDKIHIGIASGRPLHQVIKIFDDLQLRHPCVISGGAQIVDPISKKILWEQPMLHDDVQLITSIINKLQVKTWVVDDTDEILYAKDLKLNKPMSFFISKIEEAVADKVIEQLSALETLALTKVVAYDEGYIALHITHAHATKHYATMKVAELLKVKSEEIIGVGDGYNDFPLFQACGLKVAVGNAVDGLKAQADYIAPTVDEDAIAHVLEKFIN
jgi:HAD superfamily hydrolase (TIGR01484 family)